MKDAYDGKETIKILQNGKWRHILIPKNEKIMYPTIIHNKQCELFKKHVRKYFFFEYNYINIKSYKYNQH